LAPLIKILSDWAVIFLITFIPLYGYLRGVKVYETFVEGAQEGFWVAIKILPYLVAIFLAMSIFRSSGAIDLTTRALSPVIDALAIPVDVVPLMMVRPLSGSGSFGLMTDIINHWGPDSFVGRLASTMQGSTDTTFYVITVYFGSVGIKKVRYSLAVGLIADAAGMLAALYVTRLIFG